MVVSSSLAREVQNLVIFFFIQIFNINKTFSFTFINVFCLFFLLGGGFNFNAPSGPPNFGATPTAFGGAPQTPGANFGAPAQGGNMFSIGTGSTARPRTNRDRLRRR